MGVFYNGVLAEKIFLTDAFLKKTKKRFIHLIIFKICVIFRPGLKIWTLRSIKKEVFLRSAKICRKSLIGPGGCDLVFLATEGLNTGYKS